MCGWFTQRQAANDLYESFYGQKGLAQTPSRLAWAAAAMTGSLLYAAVHAPIGLRTVLPAALALTAPGARLVALIKPQFEVGPARVGKGGVVRDPALHQEVCETIATWLMELPGWQVLGITPSPIEGPAGNREFLIGGRRD